MRRMTGQSPPIGLFDRDAVDGGNNLARELGPSGGYAHLTPFLKASTLQRAADVVSAEAGLTQSVVKVRPATLSELRALRPNGEPARSDRSQLWFDPEATLNDVLGVVIGHYASLSVPSVHKDPIATQENVPALLARWIQGFDDEQQRLREVDPPSREEPGPDRGL
jgi:hypothetical protein